MSFYPHAFEAPVEKLDFGKFAYTVLYIPESLVEELSLDQNPRQRIVAEIGDFEMDAAIQPSSYGWYIMLSKRVLKACGLMPDDIVRMRFRVVDPSTVNVPEELRAALDEDATATAAWDALTPGKQRGFAYRVNSAKRPETRLKRVAEVLSAILD